MRILFFDTGIEINKHVASVYLEYRIADGRLIAMQDLKLFFKSQIHNQSRIAERLQGSDLTGFVVGKPIQFVIEDAQRIVSSTRLIRRK